MPHDNVDTCHPAPPEPKSHRSPRTRLMLATLLVLVPPWIALSSCSRTQNHTAASAAPTLKPNETDIEWGTDLDTTARDRVPPGCELRYAASQRIVVRGDGYAPATAIEISFQSNATNEQRLATGRADANGSFRIDVRLPITAKPQLGQGVQAVGASPSGQVRVAYGTFTIEPAGGPCTAITAR